MTPLIPQRILTALLFAALALVFASQAAARPILGTDELGGGPAVAAVAPDAFERAVVSQAPSGPDGTVVRTAGEGIVLDERGYPTYPSAAGEPAWLKALNARSEAMNEYYAAKDRGEPAWLKALNARSEAMNRHYGAGSAGVVRPDDRGTPRPTDTSLPATGSSGDGVAWGDVTLGALAGFGAALLVGLGGFALVHSTRRTRSIAH